MTELQRVSELGFADFVAMLLVETLDAIVASHSSQEERLRALIDAAGQDLDEFTESIADEVVDAALTELFPGGSGGTAPGAGGEVPSPELLARLGIELTPAAVRAGALTDAGVEEIRQGVRRHLARTHRESLQEVARHGVPRVRVDGGVLRSKLTFSALQRTQSQDGSSSAAPAETSSPVLPTVLGPGRLDASLLSPVTLGDRYVPLLQRGVLDSIARTRLTVTPASPSGGSPGGGTGEQTSATIYGEVEIHFHTEQ